MHVAITAVILATEVAKYVGDRLSDTHYSIHFFPFSELFGRKGPSEGYAQRESCWCAMPAVGHTNISLKTE